MGYLAFDRDAVRLLGLSLQRALIELDRVRITDDRATHGAQPNRRPRTRAVADWPDAAADISVCAAMEERRPVLTGHGDLDRALWSQVASATRMEVVVDPLDPAGSNVPIDPYLQGAAIAAVLRDSDPELLTDAEIARLNRQLELLTATGPGRWGFIDRLGENGLAQSLRATSGRGKRNSTCAAGRHPTLLR